MSSATRGPEWVQFKQRVSALIFSLWESRLQQNTPIRSILEYYVSLSKSDPFHLAQNKTLAGDWIGSLEEDLVKSLPSELGSKSGTLSLKQREEMDFHELISRACADSI